MSIKDVKMLTMSPSIVIRFGASQSGVWATNQFHHGWRYGSVKEKIKKINNEFNAMIK